MSFSLKRSLITFLLLLMPVATAAEDVMIENFELQPETRWRFFTDGVIGGVSTAFLLLDSRPFMMTVSPWSI